MGMEDIINGLKAELCANGGEVKIGTYTFSDGYKGLGEQQKDSAYREMMSGVSVSVAVPELQLDAQTEEQLIILSGYRGPQS